jgi:hypothetical protein
MFKYDEDKLIQEVEQYIRGTYSGHYVGENNVQALDLIFAIGHGEGFCVGDVLKYVARYGKKNGKSRKDLLKAIHYLILLLHLNTKEEDTDVPF